MLIHYIKSSFRNISQHKGFSLLTILGLALGLSGCLLMLLYIYSEWRYDTYHSHSNRIFRVVEQQYQSGEWIPVARTPSPLAPTLESTFAQIESATHIAAGFPTPLLTDGQVFDKLQGIYVDSNFTKIFDIEPIRGSLANAIRDPHSIILKEGTAKQMFHSVDIIGKQLFLADQYPLIVNAIIADPPSYTHLPFDFLLPFEHLRIQGANLENWNGNQFYSYVLLSPDAEVKTLEQSIQAFLTDHLGWEEVQFFLQALTDIYLRSPYSEVMDYGPRGNIQYLYLFFLIAIATLLISCINFINLSSASAKRRFREVAMRKILGAERRQLIHQFLIESFLITFFAFALAFTMAQLFLPELNTLSGKRLDWSILTVEVWVIIFALWPITSLLAGLYPAFILSRGLPKSMLQRFEFKASNHRSFRITSVFCQFLVSFLLITVSIAIFFQTRFLLNKQLGIQTERLLYIPLKGNLGDQYEPIKERLSSDPTIASVSGTNFYSMPYKWVGSSTVRTWDGSQAEEAFQLSDFRVDYDFLSTLGLGLVDGRDFSKDFGQDTVNYIINQQAAKRMGFRNPVGQPFDPWGNKPGVIIGLVEDFHFSSLKEKVAPAVIELAPSEVSYLLIKTFQVSRNQAIERIRANLQAFQPDYPLEISFLDTDYQQLYESEQLLGRLIFDLSLFAILISSLGLLGLAIFQAEQRKKEIGIRKVLGAKSSHIIQLLLLEYSRILGATALVGIPISLFVINLWLENFAYKMSIGWEIGIVPIMIIGSISFLSVWFQTWRAAHESPIIALRRE